VKQVVLIPELLTTTKMAIISVLILIRKLGRNPLISLLIA
jgi:hypothetical protein